MWNKKKLERPDFADSRRIISEAMLHSREMLYVGFGGAAVIEDPPAAEGDDVAGAAGGHHLPAKAGISVSGNELLRFLDRRFDGRRIELGGDVSGRHVVGRATLSPSGR